MNMKSNYLILLMLLYAGQFIVGQTFVSPDDSRIKFTGSYFNKVSDTVVIFRRHSDAFLALTDWNESLASDENANTNTGITINFRTDAATIDIHSRMLPGNNAWNLYVSYYVDGDSLETLKQKRDDLTAAGDSSFIYTINAPSAGEHSYRIALSTYSTIAFEGLTLTGGSETLVDEPLPEKPVYVAYGNSISHGRGQDVGNQTYPWVLAEEMGWRLNNIAVGGSKTSVPMAEMVKNEITSEIDYMTILIGYNDAVGYAKDTTYYREKLISFIDTVRAGHPETTIFVLGQTYTLTTENSNGDPVDFDDWRKVQRYIVDSLTAAGDTLIHYINGATFTDYSSLNNPPDDPVHLGIPGAYSFGLALAEVIKNTLNSSTAVFSHKSNSYISVFPNPAQKYITVSTDNGVLGKIGLFDMTGKKVLSSYSDSQITKISLGDIPDGIYLLKTEKGTRKIIKQ
ncbi:MAG: T9SS type A sorting domain-containing protein [Chlorobi bacterium]|nr:T9SS type A sorting domain-containing protein [Chlorobiota bacterium]